MAQFHYFELEEVYQYAERMGYSREDVKIERDCAEYDYDLEQEVAWIYQVSFGHQWGDFWSWDFEDLSQPAVDYFHSSMEDWED